MYFKCNDLNFVDGQIIKYLHKSWFCVQCCKNIYVFTRINNNKLSPTVNYNNKWFSPGNDLNSTNRGLVLKPPENLAELFNQFNDFFQSNAKLR